MSSWMCSVRIRLTPCLHTNHKIIPSISCLGWNQSMALCIPWPLMSSRCSRNENLQKGFIHPSTFFISSSVIFVHKFGGDIQICVNYQKLNDITIKNWYSISQLQEILNCLIYTQFFIKLNIISAFYKLHNKEEDEWKIVFHTWYKLFESLIMFFGLYNSPSSFQSFINEVFYDFLNVFCTAYLNDILIYNDNKKKHDEHVHLILICL